MATNKYVSAVYNNPNEKSFVEPARSTSAASTPTTKNKYVSAVYHPDTYKPAPEPVAASSPSLMAAMEANKAKAKAPVVKPSMDFDTIDRRVDRQSEHNNTLMDTATKRNVFDTAADTIGRGAGWFNQGVVNTGDFLANILPRVEGAIMGVDPEATFTAQLLKPATKATGAVKDYVDETVADIDSRIQNDVKDNKAAKIATDLGSGVVAALPQAVLAIMSGGASEAARLPAQATGISGTVVTAASKALNNPMTKLSFAQSLGSNYEEAKAGGASDMEAMTAATLSSLFNSVVESSGGIDALPGEIRGKDLSNWQKATQWITSALDEGKEEVVQGVITKLTQMATYDKDKQLFSMDNEDAVINPRRMAGEFGMGTAIGGIMGGGQMLTQSGLDAVNEMRKPKQPTTPDVDSVMPQVQQENKNAPVNMTEAGSKTEQAENTHLLTAAAPTAKGVRFLVNATKEQITHFVNNAFQNKNRFMFLRIADASDSLVNTLRNHGIEIGGYVHVLRDNDIRHIRKSHGDLSNDKYKVTMADIENVSDIIENYDRLYEGYETEGGNKAIVYEKTDGTKTFYVEEIMDDGVLSTKQMLKTGAKSKPSFLKKYKKITDRSSDTDVPHKAESTGQSPLGNHAQDAEETVSNLDNVPMNNADTGSDQPQSSRKQDPFKTDIPQVEQSVNGEIGDMGAKTSDFKHEVKESQSKTTPAYYEQYNIPEEGRADNHYTAVTEAESLHNARMRLEQDYDGEVAEMKAKATWSNEEMDMGQMVLDDLRQKAEETGDWSEFREWDKVNREHKSEAGRALQALAKQNRNTATDIMSNASEALESAKDGTDTNDVMNTVSEYATRYELAAETKDIDGLLQIIHDTSVTRKTGTRNGGLSKEVDWAMKRIADYARAELANAKQTDAADVGRFYDFLQNFAANGIEAIATDKQKTSIGQAYLTIRRNAMLSKAATIMRNLVGNNVFDPLDSVANNMSVPLDMLLSKITGTRSVAVDKSWFSDAKRKGSMDGLAMALLEVGLDVNSDGAASKYENAGTRTFHMANGPISQLMSTWEKYMGYMLSATDEFQKGGIRAETQRGIDKLYEQGKIKDDTLRNAGEQEALYRTFQDENAVSGLVQDWRRSLNNRFSRGGVGVGDLAMPFAQVPSTLPVRAAEYSPIGLANGIGKMAKVLRDAKKGTLTAAQQAAAVKDIGRGFTGSAMIAAAAALAAKGIIHVVAPGGEEENKDKAASEKAQGMNGTQWNLDATIRAINGESTEWRDGDTIMSIAFLDPINAQLTTGALIAEDIENDKATFERILKDSFSGALQSFLDLPVMQTAREFANAYTYSDGETPGDKLIDAATQWAAGEATSVIPNALKGIAQGTDEYQRDLYAKDDIVGQTVDQFRSVFDRDSLPIKQDVYGNDIKNPDQPLNFLNANILPGAITTYTETDLQASLNALAEETGVNSVYLSKNPPKSISVDGTNVELTDEQQRQFMTERGDLYGTASAALESDETYKDFSNEWKLKAYEFAETYATQKAKEGLDAGFKPDPWVSELEGATPEEFSEALVRKVVENMAGKAGENKYSGMGNLLSDKSIDDQIALSLMSDEATGAYTAFNEVMNVPVQQFLDIYGTATAASKKKDEQYAAAMKHIQNMDVSAYDKSALEFGTYYSMMMGKELREKYNANVKSSGVSNGDYMNAAKYYDAYKAEEHGGVDRSTAMYKYIKSLDLSGDKAKKLFLGFFSESTWEKERKR